MQTGISVLMFPFRPQKITGFKFVFSVIRHTFDKDGAETHILSQETSGTTGNIETVRL